MALGPNPRKDLYIKVKGKTYGRLPIKTHVINANDDIVSVVEHYVRPHLRNGDVVAVGERIVAISQGRSFPIETIKIPLMAKILSKFVYKPSYGIGIGSPYTMTLAMREANPIRFWLAIFLSAITKPFGIRGVFYRVVGSNIAAIDGPCDYTIPPYSGHAKLPPKNPGQVAEGIAKVIGFPVAIVDANDKATKVLGTSHGVKKRFIEKVLRDNPMGQSDEQTPICIIRGS